MIFKNFDSFNQYLGVPNAISEKIDFGIYDESMDLKQKSDFVTVDFYRISLKDNIIFKDLNQNEFKDKTIMFFNSPNQKFKWDLEQKWYGFYLQISKDTIDQHRFLFRNCLEYGLHEALVLESDEANEIRQLFHLLISHHNSDNYDLEIVLSYTNMIISFVEKFYQRQFAVHKKEYNWIVQKFQELLNEYYSSDVTQIPTVTYFAEKLNLTPNYLGDVIKYYTNHNAKFFIHNHIVENAKKLLTTTNLTTSEIAYKLGFDYPNYFAKFFKKMTNTSPSNFRKTPELNQ